MTPRLSQPAQQALGNSGRKRERARARETRTRCFLLARPFFLVPTTSKRLLRLRLQGQNCKFFTTPLSRNSQKRFEHKEDQTKYRKMIRKPRRHVRNLIYRTWASQKYEVVFTWTCSRISYRLSYLVALIIQVPAARWRIEKQF